MVSINITKYCTKCGSNQHTIFENKCIRFDEEMMRKIRSNENYILNRFHALYKGNNMNCKYCNKYFSKQKYLYYHCLVVCDYRSVIQNDLNNVDILIQ